MSRRPHIFVLLVNLYVISAVMTPLRAESVVCSTNQMIELSFLSSRPYPNPPSDITLECTFTGPQHSSYTVAGFWKGDYTYCVRFSFPAAGVWTYHLTCSDKMNKELNDKRGTIRVVPYTGSKTFACKGWPRVSADGRTLTYGNGDPFFYLGDTAWEATWKSTREEFLQYIRDRKEKGFTVIQMVVMSHQYLYDYGVRNRDGEPVFLNRDHNRINPDYFDYLDFMVQTANDSDMVVALVPLWAAMMEYYQTREGVTLNPDQALSLARYLGARYAGNNVFWIIGGDNHYDTPLRTAFWSQFARTIERASGGRQLMTVHPRGWRASYDYFNPGTDWIDFHMYQSSHIAGGDFTWQAALRGYKLLPVKPVLNGEPCYEDIFHYLWKPGETKEVDTFRIRPEHVRQASYESILSGALAGITYGANGVWQWHKETLPGTHKPRVSVSGALSFPASFHMTVLKHIMSRLCWYTFSPRQELIVDFESRENFIPIAGTNETLLVYIPPHTSWVELCTPYDSSMHCTWLDPTSGETVFTSGGDSRVTLVPPDSCDYLVSVSIPDDETINRDLTHQIILKPNFPNPCKDKTRIHYRLDASSTVTVTLFTITGQTVRHINLGPKTAGKHTVRLQTSTLASGIYIYQLITTPTPGSMGAYSNARKMIVVR